MIAHSQRCSPPDAARAFSLVELLVVIGMMTLFIGGLGMALSGSSPNVAVQNAQGILTSALGAARSEALAAQARTRLVLNGDPASEDYLRSLRVLVETKTSNVWRYAGSEIVLPRGAYVVPAAGTAGAVFEPESGGAWPTARHSSLTTSSGSLVLDDGTTLANILWTSFDFGARGLPSAPGAKLLVSAAKRPSADSLIFGSPDLIRGALVSDYGAAILLNNGTDIDH